jgi:hypothetical protein
LLLYSLVVLTDYRFLGLILILIAIDHCLLLNSCRIPVTGVLTLVARYRCSCRDTVAIPIIPTASSRLPVATPMITPTRWSITLPPDEVGRWVAIEGDGDSKDEHWNVERFYNRPGSIVPATCVPDVIPEDPVETVVEEQVSVCLWSIVDRVAWYHY